MGPTSQEDVPSQPPLIILQVVMVAIEDRVDKTLVKSVLDSGHTRIPVYQHGRRSVVQLVSKTGAAVCLCISEVN
jgi:Mg2+/Co2+ transporter CorB